MAKQLGPTGPKTTDGHSLIRHCTQVSQRTHAHGYLATWMSISPLIAWPFIDFVRVPVPRACMRVCVHVCHTYVCACMCACVRACVTYARAHALRAWMLQGPFVICSTVLRTASTNSGLSFAVDSELRFCHAPRFRDRHGDMEDKCFNM